MRLSGTAGPPVVREGHSATVPRSYRARSGLGRTPNQRTCAWPPCGRLFVPRSTGGKPQKYHAPQCRELAKAVARATCPHCGKHVRRQ